jgi:hypothetical protein
MFGRRGATWLLAALLLVLLATQLDPSIWPTELRGPRFGAPVRGVAMIGALAVGVVVLAVGTALLRRRTREPGWRPPPASIAAVAVVALVAGGFSLQQPYLRNRYVESRPYPSNQRYLFLEGPRNVLRLVFNWAHDVEDARIAIVGTTLQYPLYGKDLSNHVQYLGVRKDHGTYKPIDGCVAWRRALNAGRYDYVVTAANFLAPYDSPREERWTRDAAATLVLRDHGTSLFRLVGRLDPAGCARVS